MKVTNKAKVVAFSAWNAVFALQVLGNIGSGPMSIVSAHITPKAAFKRQGRGKIRGVIDNRSDGIGEVTTTVTQHQRRLPKANDDSNQQLPTTCDDLPFTIDEDFEFTETFDLTRLTNCVDYDGLIFNVVDEGVKINCNDYSIVGNGLTSAFAMVGGEGGEIINCVFENHNRGIDADFDTDHIGNKIKVKKTKFINVNVALEVVCMNDAESVNGIVEDCQFVQVNHPISIYFYGASTGTIKIESSDFLGDGSRYSPIYIHGQGDETEIDTYMKDLLVSNFVNNGISFKTNQEQQMKSELVVDNVILHNVLGYPFDISGLKQATFNQLQYLGEKPNSGAILNLGKIEKDVTVENSNLCSSSGDDTDVLSIQLRDDINYVLGGDVVCNTVKFYNTQDPLTIEPYCSASCNS